MKRKGRVGWFSVSESEVNIIMARSSCVVESREGGEVGGGDVGGEVGGGEVGGEL